jgi:3',5'-cyclic AMP phosphodiesterase CpdA
VSFVLAHLSDIHLGPMPKGAPWKNFALKHVIGGASWTFSRRKINDPAVAKALIADVQRSKPDHMAVTGDLVNIASHAEFIRGALWLQSLGTGDDVSFVPGNHDAYVEVPWQNGLGHFATYMTSDMAIEHATKTTALATPFPYVRLRRNVAIIGVNTGLAQSLFRATGEIGAIQRAALETVLKSLRERGFYRAVLLHHPPLPDLAPHHKALTDARDLQDILTEAGAELVLHGHNHRAMQNRLTGRNQNTAIFGVPSASSNGRGHHEPAAWNRYEITRAAGKWSTRMSSRVWDNATTRFVDGPSTIVSS